MGSCGGGASTSVIPPPPVTTVITPVPAVQGAGETSPLVGQTVTVVGIVSGDFQDGDADVQSNLGGFFMQEENPPHDASTSDGVFVFDRDATSGDVQVGDEVTVAGMIDERFGETQIIATRVDDPGPADNRRR